MDGKRNPRFEICPFGLYRNYIYRRVMNEEEAGKGLGVMWESTIDLSVSL